MTDNLAAPLVEISGERLPDGRVACIVTGRLEKITVYLPDGWEKQQDMARVVSNVELFALNRMLEQLEQLIDVVAEGLHERMPAVPTNKVQCVSTPNNVSTNTTPLLGSPNQALVSYMNQLSPDKIQRALDRGVDADGYGRIDVD